jgi:hypothetical protein
MQRTRRSERRIKTQSLLVFYLLALLHALVGCLICAASLAPLAALFLFDKGSPLRYLALLSPALIILVVLPLRFSFAQALTARYHRTGFTLKDAFNFSLYGEKVAEGAIYALHIVKWAVPLAVAGGVLYYYYLNVEAFAAIKSVTELGVTVTAVWSGVIQFFAGIFGGAYEAAKGGIVEGAFTILGILIVCALLLVCGVVRNSAYRYIWAEATELDKNPRYEARRSLRGRRFRQIGVALINLALLLPVLIVVWQAFDLKEMAEQFSKQVADALIAENLLPVFAVPYGKLAIVFFACYLPLLPVRRILTARFASARIRRQMRTPEAVPGESEPGQAPLLYEDKPAAQKKRQP